MTHRHGFFEKKMTLEEIITHAENLGVVQPESTGSQKVSCFITREVMHTPEWRQFWHTGRHGLYNFLARVGTNPASRCIVLPSDNIVEFFSIIDVSYHIPSFLGDNFITGFFNKKKN